MVANQTEIKKRKSNRNWAIQANERFNVAIHRERKAENRKKEEKLMNEWWRIRQK